MRIFVGFKLHRDISILREEDISIGKEMDPDLHFLPFLLNCYDESALEIALRLADSVKKSGITAELTGWTADTDAVEYFLRTLRALGFSPTVRYNTGTADIRFNQETVARAASDYLNAHPHDLILFGKEAPYANTGLLPAYVAELLGVPIVSNIIEIKSADTDSVTVIQREGGTIRELSVGMPCVLTVGNAVVSKLRVPTIRDRKAVQEAETSVKDFVISEKPQTPPALSVIPRKRSVYIPSGKGADAVEDVWKNALHERFDQC